MSYLDIIREIEHKSDLLYTAVTVPDEAGPIVAVKIVNSVIGDYWLALSDDEPFDPGDGLPLYRPLEIKALTGKGYGPEALQAVHRVKTVFDGTIRR